MPNGINDISPDLRDILLNRNLIADSIVDNGLSGLLNGIGTPITNTGTITETVQASEDIEDIGALYRGLMVINNPYGADEYPEVNITTDTVVNIGNLPPGTSPVDYNTAIGSKVENSLFNQYADEGREGMLRNKYIAPDQQFQINIGDNIWPASQGGSYIDENNNLNVGGPSTQPLDIAGSIINGQGIGFSPDGPEPNFDIRGTLAGRTLAAAGAIEDSELGYIGGEQLLLHLGYTSAFNLQRETLGNVNLNPLSLANPNGNGLIVPNYTVTVPTGTLGRVLDFGATVLGFETPASLLSPDSSIFQDENNVANIARANAMIKNSGKGQVIALFNNIAANESKSDLRIRYRPGFTDSRISRGANTADGINPEYYVGDDGQGGFIDLLNPKDANGNPTHMSETAMRDNILSYDTDSLDIVPSRNRNAAGYENEVGRVPFTWGGKEEQNNKDGAKIFPDNPFTDRKSILYKTKKLFETGKMRTLVSGHGDFVGGTLETSTGIQRGFMPKGSGVLSSSALQNSELTEASEVFCRTWTTARRYDQVQNLQKNTGLNPFAGNRNLDGNSVLGEFGFVNIAPDSQNPDVKKFMFSIENLAWDGEAFSDLPECEKGPGDIENNKKGRIMWFPPYDINFTDTSSVNWDATNFIGRGEPLYTYNNTERTGTLSFKIITDHPTFINHMKGEDEQKIFSILAGCEDITEALSPILSDNEKAELKKAEASKKEEKQMPKVSKRSFKVYFPNDSAAIPSNYENGDGEGMGTTQGDGFTSTAGATFPDNTDFGLNEDFLSSNFVPDTAEFLLQDCPFCRVDVKGYASVQGTSTSNQSLSDARATAVLNWVKSNLINPADPIGTERVVKAKGEGETGSATSCPTLFDENGKRIQNQDVRGCKEGRVVIVDLIPDPNLFKLLNGGPEEVEVSADVPDLSDSIKSRFFNECRYFERIKDIDPFIYSTFGEKIKYFHPSFHSITPEGLNSRINFLKQCTRQGPTEGFGSPDNLAFGKPPVCILRIGDLYHTKIVIDTVNFSFDPLVWDINPEGVGVQPMLVNVDISFKFIGGSSLAGPISRLQNAVSFNFFANTGVYDPRADKAKEGGIEFGYSPNKIKDETDEASKPSVSSNNPQRSKNQTAEATKEAGKSETTNDDVKDSDQLYSPRAVVYLVNGTANSYEFSIAKRTAGTPLSQSYGVKSVSVMNPKTTEYYTSSATAVFDGGTDFSIVLQGNDVSNWTLNQNEYYTMTVELEGSSDSSIIKLSNNIRFE